MAAADRPEQVMHTLDWLDEELEQIAEQVPYLPTTSTSAPIPFRPTQRERRARVRQLCLLGCLSVSLGIGAASLAEIYSMDILPAEVTWKWWALHDETVRSAYRKGECHLKSGDLAKEACLEEQLRRYRAGIEDGN